MRPIRLEVAAAGTYYIPVDRYVGNTAVRVTVSGLTVTSVDYTLDNIRTGPSGSHGGTGPLNMPANGVAAASATWVARTADTDGSYRFRDEPIDSIRVVLGGAGSGVITVLQEASQQRGNG